MIIPPNEKVVSSVYVKWTNRSREAPCKYSPFNSYSSFSLRVVVGGGGSVIYSFADAVSLDYCCTISHCLFFLFFAFTSTLTQRFFFSFSYCVRRPVLMNMDGCSQAARPDVAPMSPAHTLTAGPPCPARWATSRGKGLGSYDARLCVVM